MSINTPFPINLTQMPPEIILRIAEEVAFDCLDRKTLGALSLVSRYTSEVCRSLRYSHWDLCKLSEQNLVEHLARPAWADNVRHLRVPLVDPLQRDGDIAPLVAAYDEILAAVIGSARHLRSLFVVLGTPGFDHNSRPFLSATLNACMAHSEITQLDLSKLLTIQTRSLAARLIASLDKLQVLSIGWSELYWLHTEKGEKERTHEAYTASVELWQAIDGLQNLRQQSIHSQTFFTYHGEHRPTKLDSNLQERSNWSRINGKSMIMCWPMCEAAEL